MGLQRLAIVVASTVGLVAGVIDTRTTTSVSGVPLFTYETNSLTNRNIPRQHADLFSFNTKGPALSSGECKPGPGDSAWPSLEEWDALDEALGRALIRTVPLAAPCYLNWGVYDTNKCEAILANWTSPYLHENDPTSVMWPVWEGRTCLPTGRPSNATCTLGAYPVYAVNATNVAQIQLAVNFARNKRLRLVIKNTGHDYQGKSSGAASLSIWTHSLQDLAYLPNYTLGDFSGSVMHVGAGVVTDDLAKAADEHDSSVVSGMCASVGFAGGYFAGGGHSPLSSVFGLAADHILAINVVTADGRFVTVTEHTHPDLYWALRGGGPSTFGVTTSVVVRLHPKVQVTTSRITFQTSHSVSNETFWKGVKAYFENFDDLTQAGVYAPVNIRRNSPYYNGSSYSLGTEPMMAPNTSVEAFNALTKPLFDRLTELGIPYENEPRHFKSFYSAWTDAFPASQLQVAAPDDIQASRLFPRNVWRDPRGFNKAFKAIRRVSDAGHDIGAFAMAPGNPFKVHNAANPALRETIAFLSTGILLPDNPTLAQLAATQDEVMNGLLQPWREAAPASRLGGSYLNEGNAREPHWQQDFFGSNYPKLLRIKKKWDPTGLFYATAGVGSEQWEVRTEEQGIQTQNGPLCRL